MAGPRGVDWCPQSHLLTLEKETAPASLATQQLCDLRQLTTPSGLSFVKYKMGP